MTKNKFIYSLEDSKIREYMKVSAEDKLLWLEEINIFTQMVLTEKQKELRNKIRTGEL
ncbi:MAG: hypothetical protein PHV30_08965 [Candidatus Margulisbacteria bacterium]|nr:hypothetical protein [Candidatus Margulisiibacteriota bacterium]